MAEQPNKIKPIPDSITHFGQLKNSDFLASYDLPEDKAVKVTIESLRFEEVTNPENFKKEFKDVIVMKNKVKRLILNVSKRKAIASWHGPDPHGWIGKEISLVRGRTKMKGKPVDCINVVADDKAETRDRSAAAESAAQ